MQVAYREWLDNNVGATVALLASTRPDLRGWEYRYLNSLCHTDLITFKGHGSDFVTSAAFSPDGTRIVTSGAGGGIRVWDAKTGIELLELKGEVQIPGNSVRFKSDGTQIYEDSRGVTVRVWDARTGAEVMIRTFDTGKGKAISVWDARLSPRWKAGHYV